MDKSALLNCIAQTGYNVGFGAKKHFATYDLVEKGPGWIGFCSTAIGILALIYDPLSAKWPSAILVIAGVIALYISFYKSSEYEAAGREMTSIYIELRNLYYAVQGGADIVASEAMLNKLEQRFSAIGISKQILFSDWWAHLKFFFQHQIGWVDEQLHFKFWKDKVPASAKPWIFLILAFAIWWLVGKFGFVASPCSVVNLSAIVSGRPTP